MWGFGYEFFGWYEILIWVIGFLGFEGEVKGWYGLWEVEEDSDGDNDVLIVYILSVLEEEYNK